MSYTLTSSAAAGVVVGGGWWGISTSHLSSDSKTLGGKGKKKGEKKEIKKETGRRETERKRIKMSLFTLCLCAVPLSMERGLTWRQGKGGGGGKRRGGKEEREKESMLTPAVEGAVCVCFSVWVSWFEIPAQFEGSRSKSAWIDLIGAFLPQTQLIWERRNQTSPKHAQIYFSLLSGQWWWR